MKIAESMLPEFDHEMTNTRKELERIPDDKFGWKPHPKSMSLGDLASHITEIPGWAGATLKDDHFDFAPKGKPAPVPTKLQSREEILSTFDQKTTEARLLLAAADDSTMQGNWALLNGGETVFSMPRVAVFRSFILNHLIHHRAQLGVYLRMNEIPLPSIYGPSADEGQM